MGTGGSQYSASYGASGNMLCRAPDGSTTCAGGTTTGQQLSWDNEGRLTAWQNVPSSPTSTAQYLYDGEGNRVEQQTTTGGTTTTTVYVGDIEQVATTGGTTTTTTYYYANGQRIALAVNGTLSYLASDLLGSATAALNSSGTPTASQLYAPYGGTRYSNGTMPTDYGFTGQRADVATGMDYYGARYYDPTLGQFTAADTVLDGLNRYSYVGGNPIRNTDPSGHWEEDHPDPWGAEGESPSSLGEGDDGDGADGGSGTGSVGPGLTIGPAGDMSPDLTVIETPEGFEYVDPTYTDADARAETQDIRDSQDLMRAEAQIQANDPPPETPNTPNTPNQPETPNTPKSSNGDGNGPATTDEDLYAFGPSPNPSPSNPSPDGLPRGPRPGIDIDVDDGMVKAQTPPGVNIQGASTFTDPAKAPLSGHFYHLPAGSELPDGLGVYADGADVGGTAPWGHRTVYPSSDMSFENFRSFFRELPWEYGGKK